MGLRKLLTKKSFMSLLGLAAGTIAAAVVARAAIKTMQKTGASAAASGGATVPHFLQGTPSASKKFLKGGFESPMSKREAALILGVKESVNKDKLKEAHRRIMLLNHPDRGAYFMDREGG